MSEEEEVPRGVELVDEELAEVFRCSEELVAQSAIEEVLTPIGIPAMVHDRVSHAIPAPAAMPGGYFVAVPVAQATAAVAALKEALADGVLPADGEVAKLA
jgi:hypothetical protein